MKQDDVFITSEGDQWFKRNRDALEKKNTDLPFELACKAGILKDNITVLEIGCSTGYRLNMIQQKFKTECFGLEASKEAVSFGREKFPNLKLVTGEAALLPYTTEQFDVVIINFVLHWIDRQNLLKVFSEVDRVLKTSGSLVLGDFYPDKPTKRPYHHVTDREMFTYKQHYPNMFTSSGMYQLIEENVFDYNTLQDFTGTDFSNRCSLAVLKKLGDQGYVV
jgi:ubiquinone/menaquinone biosynthesis C-methylase UbiE